MTEKSKTSGKSERTEQSEASEAKDSRNIYERINAVTTDVKFFYKDSRNEQFHFSYASIENVIASIHDACVKHRIALVYDSVLLPATTNKNKSGEINLVNVEIIMRAMNIDNPSDYVEVKVPGAGYDTLDKGIYKAISGGRKYAIFAMFNLIAGEPGKMEADATTDIDIS